MILYLAPARVVGYIRGREPFPCVYRTTLAGGKIKKIIYMNPPIATIVLIAAMI